MTDIQIDLLFAADNSLPNPSDLKAYIQKEQIEAQRLKMELEEREISISNLIEMGYSYSDAVLELDSVKGD